DRGRCVIRTVEKAGKHAGVVGSPAAPELVMRLFEQEVPEIYDNTVVIKGCAREAGERTKIAVVSRDRDVDSVGACVGMKGMRVQSIIRELRGEKIDIIEFSDDPVVFATHALSPAKISRVSIVTANDRHMEVIVDDTQLSLAIGKKGQNVRLAAKLLGWKIDIKSEEEKRQEVETAMSALVPAGAPVSVLQDHDLSESIVEQLAAADVGTIEKLGSMTPEELEEIPGIGPQMVEKIFASVNSYYSQFEETQSAAEPAGESGVGSRESEAEQTEAAGESGVGSGNSQLEGQAYHADKAAQAVLPGSREPETQQAETAAGAESSGDEVTVEQGAAAPLPDEEAALEPEPPAPKNDDPHPVSTAGEGEFDTIKDSENAG